MQTSIDTEQLDLEKSHSKKQIQNAHEVFKIQQKAYQAMPFPEEKLRKQQLKALKKAIIKHKEKLIKAVSADFGHRSQHETLLTDLLLTIMNINYAIKNLRHWMSPEKRSISLLFQPAKARLMYQPLGVVGIMAPWNYPVYLLLSPLVAAIAAGNRALLKPSEFSPYSNRVLNEIIQEAFLKNEVYMVEGNAEVANQFSQLPFEHLFFTGSSHTGKKVMAAAAQNLTSVTLELGGKSPAIIASDINTNFAVERMLYGKCLNNGQSCVAPDYVLCPEDKVPALIRSFQQQFKQLYPDISNGDYSCIINDTQYQRIHNNLLDAKEKGAKIIPLAEFDETNPRLMPLQLLTNVNRSMAVMREENFGPILPIVAYKNLKQAINFVHSLPRPLALYIFTKNKKLEDQIMRDTHSGGACINEATTHVAQSDLPFGGVGASGMGSYQGKEGFLTFSNSKAIFKRGAFNSAKNAYPPYGKLIHKLIYWWYLK